MKIRHALFAGMPAAVMGVVARAQDEFSVLDDLALDDLVEVPEPISPWLSLGGPLALTAFAVFLIVLVWWTVPFRHSRMSINLHDFSTGVKRGLAMAVTIYGIAFAFGASEIAVQLHYHGSAEEYFLNMSLAKLIAFTHAHLFGFTTSFLVIGVPFSMQFNHLWPYQWIFPLGLVAALVDVMSWWGIKYVAPSFELVSMGCGIVFSLTYLYMLIGILRVLLFPQVVWATDKDAEDRRAQIARKRARRNAEGWEDAL